MKHGKKYNAALSQYDRAAVYESAEAIETVKKTNQNLIETIDTVIKVHEDGRVKRQAAEKELENIEKELKAKLLEINVKPKEEQKLA